MSRTDALGSVDRGKDGDPMAPTRPTDEDLLAAHLAGDPAGFEEIVRRHQDRLWAVALRTLGDRDDAADAVQDGLLSAYRNAASFRGDAAVTTWLHRIVVNACFDLARRRAARPSQPLPELPDTAARDVVADRDTGLALLDALRALPVESASAVVLVDIEGFPVAEAAAMLDVPVGTVKSRCARARARLAELLRDEKPGSGNAAAAAGVQPQTPRGPDDEVHR